MFSDGSDKIGQEYKKMMEYIPFGILLWNEKKELVFQNKKMKDFSEKHGFDSEENPFVQFSNAYVQETEIRGEVKDVFSVDFLGKSIFYEMDMFLIQKEDGGFLVGAMIREIQHRKKLEEELQERNNTLVLAMEELKEAQRQLIQQEKLASVGQLAAGVAHEINNPLGFVMSNLSMLKEYEENYRKYILLLESLISKEVLDSDEFKEQKEKTEVEFTMDDIGNLLFDTEEGLHRIERIVRSLRSFSRFEEEETFRPYDINQGIKDTLVIAKNEVKYDAEAILELQEVSQIEAYGGLINQVLLNLVMNSVHAIQTFHSGNFGKIIFRTGEQEDFVYCEIEDNGCGIKEENLDKIFNPFFTTKEEGKGTGLGMSISYDIIVNKHHGELLISSEELMGTTITIKLPIKQQNREVYS